MKVRFFAFFLIFSKFAKVFVLPEFWIRTGGKRTDTWTTAYFMHLLPGVYLPAGSHGWASRPSFPRVLFF